MTKKVLVLGGYGACGRRIAARLARDPGVECVIGGRDVRRGQEAADALSVSFATVDIRRPTSLNAALDGVFAVVNACGPFLWRDYAIAERCARRGVHYVDMADDASYMLGIQTLAGRAREGQVALVSGAGSALAFSSVLAETLSAEFDVIHAIDIAQLSGNRTPRGPGCVRSLLSAQRRRVRLFERGQWREVPGFSRGRTVEMPKPFGKRRLYMVDAAETEFLGKHYQAPVTYRTGLELAVLNRGHAWLASLNRHGLVQDTGRFAGLLHGLQHALRGFGVAAFGLTVVMSGERSGRALVRRAALLAREEGHAAGCIPAIALVRKWAAGGGVPDATPCYGVLSLQDMTEELAGQGAVLQLS